MSESLFAHWGAAQPLGAEAACLSLSLVKLARVSEYYTGGGSIEPKTVCQIEGATKGANPECYLMGMTIYWL